MHAMKIKIIAALACSMLTSGCVITAVDYPYNDGAVVVVPSAPVEIYEPSVIIVENGIRHDRYYYQRYPDAYRRDYYRYPDRFRHLPPPRYGRPAPPPPPQYWRGNAPKYGQPYYGRQGYKHDDHKKDDHKKKDDKKKKHHDDHNH